ncbi:MAG: hypothetical protein JW809_09150 [Pirellulales bacterium]|nr:hypothetical protein [Pirellulales bacterium]
MTARFDWWPRGGIGLLAVCFIVASIGFLIMDGNTWYTRWVCPFFLPLGVGLLLRQSWARWVTFAFFVVIAVLVAVLMARDGLTLRSIVRVVIVASSLVALWRWNVYPEDEESDADLSLMLEDDERETEPLP